MKKDAEDNLKLLINSFGNDRKSYLYNEEISDVKYNLARDIISNHNIFSGYKQTETYERAFTKYDGRMDILKQLHQLGQLQTLERLQQLERAEQLNQLQQIQGYTTHPFTTFDYKQFSNVTNAIIYLDPPYEATGKYYHENGIDYKEFYDWAVEMSHNNVVLISSYNVSDERFEVVYNFEKARSTKQGGTGNGKNEKLFMVKDN